MRRIARSSPRVISIITITVVLLLLLLPLSLLDGSWTPPSYVLLCFPCLLLLVFFLFCLSFSFRVRVNDVVVSGVLHTREHIHTMIRRQTPEWPGCCPTSCSTGNDCNTTSTGLPVSTRSHDDLPFSANVRESCSFMYALQAASAHEYAQCRRFDPRPRRPQTNDERLLISRTDVSSDKRLHHRLYPDATAVSSAGWGSKKDVSRAHGTGTRRALLKKKGEGPTYMQYCPEHLEFSRVP